MKKFIAMLLLAITVLSLIGCGSKSGSKHDDKSAKEKTEETAPDGSSVKESTEEETKLRIMAFLSQNSLIPMLLS